MHTQSRSVSRWSLLLVALMLLLPTLACSLSQPDVDATATYEAAEAYATQTAEAKEGDGADEDSAETLKPKGEQATRTPEPVEQDEGPVTVSVKADGSGDYATLEAAMLGVPEGSTIVLDGGSFVLTEPIDRTASVTLEGAGMDTTEVSCAAPGFVVHFGGGGSFSVRNMTLRHEGSAEADVLWVDDGEVKLESVRVSGAVTSDDAALSDDSADAAFHAGVRLSGSAVGAIFSSEATGNNLDGIRLEDQASVTVEDSTCSDNVQAGIHFLDASTGTVKRNFCGGNGMNGIVVKGTARATIEDNSLDANDESGLAYFDTGGGSARNNDMMNNALHGISVNDDAQPTLEDNVCSANAEDGLVYFERSGGTARGNTCSGNGLHGISVTDEAAPLLVGNVCRSNAEVGIRYGDSGGGTARDNEATENGLSGIIVRDDAGPVLENNICNDNVESGIAYFQNSSGVARDNKVIGNGLHGIDLYDTSTPVLELNVVSENAEVGIRISGDAAPRIVDNAVARNGLSGIVVRERAWPSIEDNWIEASTESGLIYFGTSGGLPRGNEIVESLLNAISVNDEASPIIQENFLRDSVESGVAYFETAGGILQANTITGNKWGIYVSDTANPAIGDNTVLDNVTDVDDRRPAGQQPPPATAIPPYEGILFYDDFTSPDPGWWTGSNEKGEAWFEDGELRILNWTESVFAMHTEPGMWFEDVEITVESRLVDGSDDNWHDVSCRRQSSDAYYLVGYSADGYVKMEANYAGEVTYYLDVEESTAVNQGWGVVNTMQLICNGSTITFRLNGQLIGEFTDGVLTDGDISFAVSSMDGTYSDVAFDNLEVVVP